MEPETLCKTRGRDDPYCDTKQDIILDGVGHSSKFWLPAIEGC